MHTNWFIPIFRTWSSLRRCFFNTEITAVNDVYSRLNLTWKRRPKIDSLSAPWLLIAMAQNHIWYFPSKRSMANPQATVGITDWLTTNVPILCGLRPLSWEGPKDCGATSILLPQDGRELGGHRVRDGHFQGGSRLCPSLPHRPHFRVFYRDH